MATHSSTLAWKIPWMEEPGRLQSMGLLRVRHWATSLSLFTFHFHALEKEMATHSNIHACRIPGIEEPSGLLSMGSHKVGHNWSDLAAAGGWRHLAAAAERATMKFKDFAQVTYTVFLSSSLHEHQLSILLYPLVLKLNQNLKSPLFSDSL